MKSFSLLGISRLLGALAQAVALVVLARNTEIHEFGLFSTIFAVQSTIFTVSALGIPTYVLREWAHNHSGNVRGAFRLNWQSTALAAPIAFIATFWIGNGWLWVFAALTLSMSFVIEKNTEVASAVRIARGTILWTGATVVVRPAVALGATLFAHDTTQAVVLYCSGRVLGAGVSYLIVSWRLRLDPSRGHVPFTAMARSIWAIAVATSVTTFAGLDTALVAGFGSTSDAGVYAAAMRIISPAGIVAAAMASVMMGRVARMDEASAVRIRRLLVGGIGVLIPVAVGVAVAAPWGMSVIYGTKYSSGGPVLVLLVLAVPFLVVSPLYETYLQGRGRERAAAGVSVVFTPIQLAGATLGALLAGGLGAAASLLVIQIVKVVVQVILSRSSRLDSVSEDRPIVSALIEQPEE